MDVIVPLNQISVKDRKIMFELDSNARQSNANIAKKVNLNKNVVNYHINKLEERGLIQGYYSIVNTPKLGYEALRVYLKWRSILPEKKAEIIDFVTKSPITWWVGGLEGSWDLGFIVWVKNIYEFQKFWEKLTQKYQKYILNRTVSLYSKIYDCNYAFISPEKRPVKKVCIVGEAKPEKLSRLQINLVEILAENARLPVMEIAKKLNASPLTIAANIKQLKNKEILLGFRTKFNLEALGFTHYKVNFNLKDFSRYPEMIAFGQAHPNIIYLDESIGFADFEIEIAANSHKKFQEIVEEFNGIFGEDVIDYNYFIYSAIHKIRYFKM